MTNPADLSAAELLAAYATKSLSPVEATRAVIDRIDALEPKLKALYGFDPDSALGAARTSEVRWLKGTARGLEGVPTTIKENIRSRGTPVPLGTAASILTPA
ncbi:MAG: amidase family protein, partial [Hyphomicrobiaceae bacterium]